MLRRTPIIAPVETALGQRVGAMPRRGSVVFGTRARAAKSNRISGQRSSDAFPGLLAAFVQGLKDTGFIEGKNITIEWRWAEGQYHRLPSLAGELVSRGVAVIVAWDAPAAFAAKAATKTIPIVFGTGADPVKTGLVDSFSRAGGNLTGVTFLISMLGPKRLELLSELLPADYKNALTDSPRAMGPLPVCRTVRRHETDGPDAGQSPAGPRSGRFQCAGLSHYDT